MKQEHRDTLFALLVVAALTLGGCASLFNVATEEPAPPDPLILYDAVPTSVDSDASSFTAIVATDIEAVDDLFVGDDVTLGDDVAISGDLDVAGSTELDGGFTVDDTAFAVTNATGVTAIAGQLTVADNLIVDGDTDEIQIRAQGHTTQTSSLLVLEQSDGTDKFTVSNAGNTAVVGTLTTTGATALNGGLAMDTDKFTVADTTGNTVVAGTLNVAGVMTGPAIGTENLRLPTIESSAIITTTDGAIWTVGASEVWWIDRVFCNVTTNFDCTGDDCTIEIGLTGGDIDGFLDLDDGELQTTDAEIAGLAAGWQGFGSTDTRGAFFAAGGGVILANDTIDIKIEDNSATTDPTAGAATCYIVYTRLQ